MSVILKKFIYCIGLVLLGFDHFRAVYLRHRINFMVSNGGGYISERCIVAYPSHVIIGHNSYINGGYIMASKNANIIIGKNCLISYDVHIRTDMHLYSQKNVLINQQGKTEKDIIIEDDCWIGFGAQIMPGVTVGKGTVIGAGAVLTKNADPYSVYVGVPARKIKDRI